MPDDRPAIELKELSPRHKQAMALLAQGVDRQTVAAACDYTPEYITWLARQPLCKAYLQEMSEFVDTRFQALFEQSADVIADTMRAGSEKGRLQAAKLTLEVNGRIGPGGQRGTPATDDDRLERLAGRLVHLMGRQVQGQTIEGQAQRIPKEQEVEDV